MSYLSRLIEETGLRPSREAGSPITRADAPAPPVATVEPLETDESREVRADVPPAAPPPTRAVPSPPPAVARGDAAPSARPAPPPEALAPQGDDAFHAREPASPPQPARVTPAPPRPALALTTETVTARVPETTLPADEAPSTSAPPRPGSIDVRTPSRKTPLGGMPPPPPHDPAARVLETIAAVHAWVAAGPTPDGGRDSPAAPDSRPATAAGTAFDFTRPPEQEPSARSGTPPDEAPRPPEPAVQNVSLSIGAIELTVEAPAGPPVPSPPPAAPVRAAEPAADGVAQRLRRHYVNWLGGL
jgi:hypothetical protein